MSDLISRSDLIKDLMEQIPLAENVYIFKDIIESQPTVSEKEIRGKVIEEFAEKLSERLTELSDNATICGGRVKNVDFLTLDTVIDTIRDISAVMQNYCYESDRLTTLQGVPCIAEIRNRVIEEALEKCPKAICAGCGYLNDHECTYNGTNCAVSKPMLEAVTKALEQMKEVGE